jgi:hypothetical protein
MWIQLFWYPTQKEAVAALEALPRTFPSKSRRGLTVIASDSRPPFELRGVVAGWAHEQATILDGDPGMAVYVAYVVGGTLFHLSVCGSANTWEWNEVQDLAQRQADILGDHSGAPYDGDPTPPPSRSYHAMRR